MMLQTTASSAFNKENKMKMKSNINVENVDGNDFLEQRITEEEELKDSSIEDSLSRSSVFRSSEGNQSNFSFRVHDSQKDAAS